MPARLKPAKPKASRGQAANQSPRILHLAVQYACNDDRLPSRPRLRRWVKAALENSAEVAVRFVDAAEGRRLNRDFRGKDYATNVLSFPYETAPTVLGDLVVCLPVVVAEAAEQDKEVGAHFAHMIVHGMLHLQGYDHELDEAAAELMEAREREILQRLGYPDPYVKEI